MKRGCLVGAIGVGGLLVAAVVAGVVALFVLDDSFGGPCGRDSAPSPRPVVRSSEIPAYEAANGAEVAVLASRLGEPEQAASTFAHQCGGTAGSVVGVTTSFRYRMPGGVAMCDLVGDVETVLRGAGWEVATIYTADPAGAGSVGASTATRGSSTLQVLGWRAQVDELVVAVDSRAAPRPDGSVPPRAMTCPR